MLYENKILPFSIFGQLLRERASLSFCCDRRPLACAYARGSEHLWASARASLERKEDPESSGRAVVKTVAAAGSQPSELRTLTRLI
jgi:hypothetical protein